MENTEAVALGHMPAVEPSVTALIVALEEVKCPSAQCRITDNYVYRAYDTAARTGRQGNTLSHLLLALFTSLQEEQVNDSTRCVMQHCRPLLSRLRSRDGCCPRWYMHDVMSG